MKDLQTIVTIEVKITPSFLWSVIKSILKGRVLRITHTYNNNPFDVSDINLQQNEMSVEDYFDAALGEEWEDVMFGGES